MRFQLILNKDTEESVVVTAHRESLLTDELEAVVRRHADKDRLTVFSDDEQIMLPFEDIECVTVSDGKTYAIDTDGRRLRVKNRLCEVEGWLPAVFVRINKSTIANVQHLSRFSPTYSGGVDAVFRSGYVDYVSRRCFSEIKRRLR